MPKFFLIICLMAAAGFAGCTQRAGFYSPEIAAVQAVHDFQMPGFLIDNNSEKVLQKKVEGAMTLVVVSFTGTRPNNGVEICLFDVETVRTGLFNWRSGDMNGNCIPNPPAPDQLPLSINNSHFGAVHGVPAYSFFSGLALRENIAMVQITWNDELLEEISNVNSSFLSSRAGNFNIKQIEVFDTEMKNIYTHVFQ